MSDDPFSEPMRTVTLPYGFVLRLFDRRQVFGAHTHYEIDATISRNGELLYRCEQIGVPNFYAIGGHYAVEAALFWILYDPVEGGHDEEEVSEEQRGWLWSDDCDALGPIHQVVNEMVEEMREPGGYRGWGCRKMYDDPDDADGEHDYLSCPDCFHRFCSLPAEEDMPAFAHANPGWENFGSDDDEDPPDD